MSKPRGDRLDLLRATRANLEPIWGLSLTLGLSRTLIVDGPPLATCTDTRGAQHCVYAVTDADRVAAIHDAVAASPVVIADGHHRYETSVHYRAERRKAGEAAEGAGGVDSIMTMIVELADDQLAVQPIHRLVTNLSGADPRTMLAEWFTVEDLGANESHVIDDVAATMSERRAMALVDSAGVALLVPRAEVLAPLLEAEPVVVRHVDAAAFEVAVAPALEKLGATVSYRHDRHTVAEQVAKGVADAAVLLRPVDVPTIRAVAEQHERMPQKTTFFHPKPSTGLVFRSLDL